VARHSCAVTSSSPIYRQQREKTPLFAQNALTVDWDVKSFLQKVLNQLPVDLIDAETGEEVFLKPTWEPPLTEYRPNRPKRTRNIWNTKPASGVTRFDPFHSMHYDAEEAEAAPTVWIDLLEGRVEPELPNRYDALIAEFAGEVEEDRGRIFIK